MQSYSYLYPQESTIVKRAIIFDFGGVFMKTLDYRPRHAWDERLGLAHGSIEKIVHGSPSWQAAQLGNITVEAYWADVGLQLGLDSNALETLKLDFFSGDQLDDALVDYARSLRKRGHIVALLSNDGPTLSEKLAVLGISDVFDPLIISANIGVMKPDPQAYEAVLDHIKYPSDNAIFIDDMPANIAGARNLGIHAIHYTTTPMLQIALETLLSGGD
ncbi:MAG: HAD family phosphatase [Chloroflexota bacterium]